MISALLAELQVTPDVPIALVQLCSPPLSNVLVISSNQLYAVNKWVVNQGTFMHDGKSLLYSSEFVVYWKFNYIKIIDIDLIYEEVTLNLAACHAYYYSLVWYSIVVVVVVVHNVAWNCYNIWSFFVFCIFTHAVSPAHPVAVSLDPDPQIGIQINTQCVTAVYYYISLFLSYQFIRFRVENKTWWSIRPECFCLISLLCHSSKLWGYLCLWLLGQ